MRSDAFPVDGASLLVRAEGVAVHIPWSIHTPTLHAVFPPHNSNHY